MTFDPTLEFVRAFTAEVTEQATKTNVMPGKWRAGGRATKANPDKENEAWWLANGPKQVQSWLDWRSSCSWQIAEFATNPAIEMEMNPTFEGVLVKMFLDRVFVMDSGELCVVDIKTGSRTPSSSMQLGFYAAGLEATLGVRPQWGAYWMSRQGGLTPLADLDHWTPRLLGRQLGAFKRGVQAQAFAPNLSSLCGSCSVNRACVAYGGDSYLLDPDAGENPVVDISDLPPHVSYSAFTSYMQCPKRFQLERVLHVPETPSWWLCGGGAVHKATEVHDLQEFAVSSSTRGSTPRHIAE